VKISTVRADAKCIYILFEDVLGHPRIFIVLIIKAPLLGCLLLEAPRLCILANKYSRKLFTTISITAKAESDAELGFLLPR
jgi:hypothetical protein